jgi:hypothetical protein
MSDTTPALDEAFERMAAASFELPNGFVNHGGHGLPDSGQAGVAVVLSAQADDQTGIRIEHRLHHRDRGHRLDRR